MKFETFNYADVNTRHITDNDAKLLEREDHKSTLNFVVIMKYDEGFYLTIGNEFSEEDVKEIVEAGYSKEFADLLMELHQQGIHYLRLDRDGYEVEGALSFDW